jgi:hypothetical protein
MVTYGTADHHKNIYATHIPGFSSFLPYYIASSSIHNVSEGNFYSKTQNSMFTRCFVDNIFEQTADT